MYIYNEYNISKINKNYLKWNTQIDSKRLKKTIIILNFLQNIL